MKAIIEKIKTITAEEFATTIEELNTSNFELPRVARQAAMNLISEFCLLSDGTIGPFFGNRTHGSVFNARKRVSDALDVNPGFKMTYQRIKERIQES
jgi:chromosomal replication initiation ATPase DnaA